MKLYLLLGNATGELGPHYKSCVVAAESAEAAKKICPDKDFKWSEDEQTWIWAHAKLCYLSESECRHFWASSPSEIGCIWIGAAVSNMLPGIVYAWCEDH